MSHPVWEVAPRGPLRGELRVPGDKSISHRALLLSALANGTSLIRGLLHSEDVEATERALRGWGVDIVHGERVTAVTGSGGQLREAVAVIDCGNSGTTLRLLSGVAASQPFVSIFSGDASLNRRPMRRLLDPLRQLGAEVLGSGDSQYPPFAIRGREHGVFQHFELSVASAQVKSAILLASLRAGVALREPRQSRDHTERMLTAMGVELRKDDAGWLHLAPTASLHTVDIEVPGDLSSAAFFLVAAAITPGSDVMLKNIGINPTRTGVIDALLAMGADLQVFPHATNGWEPVADIRIRHAPLRATRIAGELALRSIDELPVLSIAAAFAEGQTTISDAAELRVKESDRIARIATGLRTLGVRVEESPDGLQIVGGPPTPNKRLTPIIDAHLDHRIAMSFAVAGCATPAGVRIEGADTIASSYPDFASDLESLRD